MVVGDNSVNRYAPLPSTHLNEQLTVAQLAQRLEELHFDKHECARVMIDPGVQAFLVRATKAAAADHLDARVRHSVALDPTAAMSARRFPPPWSDRGQCGEGCRT